ncbi:MAG: hypothetical protein MJ088_04545 [Clostridia bacterium]|nr:hypothetical protein [Clostridia bacterium]
MKLRRIISAFFALLMLGAVVLVSAASAEDGTGAVASAVSEPFDVIAAADTTTGNVPWAHGNNQTRLVNVSSGTYIGVLTGDSFSSGDWGSTYNWSLIRVLPDGKTVEKLYSDIVYGVSTTITVMADAEENIWVYSGYTNPFGSVDFNVWKYDVASGEITHTMGRKKPKAKDLGYSVAFIDPVANKIYAVATTGGAGIDGDFCWNTFDITTGEWGNPQFFREHDRYGYEYGYGDGKGGFYVLCEQSGPNDYMMSNLEGMSVGDAMRQFRSRKEDANFMWDEGHLIHVIDAANSNAYENIVIEPARYDVERGVYPNWASGEGDLLTARRDGLVYALSSQEDNGTIGIRNTVYVFDPNNEFACLGSKVLEDLYFGADYCHRFFEDTEGNLYLVRSCQESADVEVWSLTFADGKFDIKLAALEDLGGSASAVGQTGTFFISTSRGNSTPSDVAHCIIKVESSYHYFEIDFAKIRASMK